MSSSFGGVTEEGGYHHRSNVKRGNKPFKGKSKGKQERSNRGKIEGSSSSSSSFSSLVSSSVQRLSSIPENRQARLNRSKQLQRQKRQELLLNKRVGARAGPPRLIALIPLSARTEVSWILETLAALPNSSFAPSSSPPLPSIPLSSSSSSFCCDSPHLHSFSWSHGAQSRRFMLFDTPRDQQAILDIAKVADILCFLLSPRISESSSSSSLESSVLSANDDGEDSIDVDDFGAHAVTLLKAQGLVSVIGLTVPSFCSSLSSLSSSLSSPSLSSSPPSRVALPLSTKRSQQFRRTAQRYFHTAFGSNTKVQHMEDVTSAAQLLRFLSEIKLKNLFWRDSRPYLCSSRLSFDAERRILSITGFLRGNGKVSADQLVHLTGVGDFQLGSISSEERREEKRGKGKSSSSSSVADTSVAMKDEESEEKQPYSLSSSSLSSSSPSSLRVVSRATSKRESLVSLQTLNPLANEQSLITDEEIAAAERAHDEDMGEDEQREASEEEEETGYREESKGLPHGRIDAQSAWSDALNLSDDDNEAALENDEDDAMNEASALATIKMKLERDEIDYPDEVSYPMDTICRERFARYRGLKSSKSSPWDARENLPLEYGQIFQFANFKHSRAVAMRREMRESEQENAVAVDLVEPITLHVVDVGAEVAASLFSSAQPLCVFFLLAHEHKVSVSHFLLQRYAEYDQPIKGKEKLEFHCGFRRFTSRPIFSQHRPDSDDAKASRALVERYLHQDRFTVATVYQRIMFPPAPVIAFMPQSSVSAQQRQVQLNVINPIVAAGSMLSVDPDRILMKRVILTGSPISTHKRHAVVRHMFFNAPDVSYFKPVELHTKMGLVGHIVESRGMKGHMKCLFDGHIKQNDTVCLSLYKRQYPPFDDAEFGDH